MCIFKSKRLNDFTCVLGTGSVYREWSNINFMSLSRWYTVELCGGFLGKRDCIFFMFLSFAFALAHDQIVEISSIYERILCLTYDGFAIEFRMKKRFSLKANEYVTWICINTSCLVKRLRLLTKREQFFFSLWLSTECSCHVDDEILYFLFLFFQKKETQKTIFHYKVKVKE